MAYGLESPATASKYLVYFQFSSLLSQEAGKRKLGSFHLES